MNKPNDSGSCCVAGDNNPDCIQAVLHRSLSCRLGLVNGTEAYVVPMIFTFLYDNDRQGFDIYLHLNHSEAPSKAGDIISTLDYLYYHQENSIDVCVQCDVVGPFIPSVGEVKDIGCYWTLAYSSMIGYGEISKVTDDTEKNNALWRQLFRYTGKDWRDGETIPKEFQCADVWKVSLAADRTTAKFHHIDFPSAAHGC